MTPTQQHIITQLFEKNRFGVIATTGPTAPESATMTILMASTEAIIFRSMAHARKNNNIAQHPTVSFVIGWDPVEKETLQIEGTAARIPDDALPEPYTPDPAWQYFRITPTWIRYTNLAQNPFETWEISL